MFRKDRAIIRDNKRRQDSVYIQALTISLANSILKEVAYTSVYTNASRDTKPEEPDRKLMLVPAVASSLPDNTTVYKAKAYGHT